jgi:hypothetical protein
MFHPFPPLILLLREGNRDYTYNGHGVLNGSKGALELYSLYSMIANLRQ